MITDHHAEMIRLLNRVRFLPGSWDKRFAKGVSGLDNLSPKQTACLEKMFHRYRRQIKGHERICPICNKDGYQLGLFDEKRI